MSKEQEIKEAIDTLEGLQYNIWDEIGFHYKGYVCCKEEMHKYDKDFDSIKQVLQKVQEPKKNYLKWEDLEFKNYEQEIPVLLNGNKYSLKYTLLPDDDYYMVWIYKKNKCRFSLDGKYLENKQLFNDLHLERVEE